MRKIRTGPQPQCLEYGCCRTTSPKSLSQDLYIRILLEHLYQDPVGPLVQDLCLRILSSTCIRIKISVSGSLHQDLLWPCARSLSQDLPLGSFWSICIRILLRTIKEVTKTQFYQHSVQLITKHERLTGKSEDVTLRAFCPISTHDLHCRVAQARKSTLPAFRALDMHDLRRRFTFRKTWFSRHVSETLRLPRNHGLRSSEIQHWPRQIILKFKFQKCNPPQQSSPSMPPT